MHRVSATPRTTETVTWRYHRTSLSSKRTKPMLTYHQITAAERYTLGLLRQRGLCPAAIARVLGRHRSTIGREVRRNGTPRDGCYRPELADWYAGGRRSRSRRNQRFSPADWTQAREL